jgi:hypothetical protein
MLNQIKYKSKHIVIVAVYGQNGDYFYLQSENDFYIGRTMVLQTAAFKRGDQ